MNETSNIVRLRQPDEIDDPLTNILRSGARQLACAGGRDGSRGVSRRHEGFEACLTAATVLCGTATAPSARSRRGSGLSRSARVKIRDRGAAMRWRADSLHLGDPAAVGAAHEEPGCAVAGALSARHLDGRLPGGAGGAAGQGRAEPVAGGDLQTDGGVEGRVRALAEARSVGAPVRVRVGGRCLPAGSHGRPQANACWC